MLFTEQRGYEVGSGFCLLLARRLGISRDQAGRIIAGTPGIGMHRLAFHYGFMPEIGEPDAWRALPMTEQPFDDGPEMRWDATVVEYVHDVLRVKGDLRPSARELAWRMDTTERQRDLGHMSS